MKFFPFSKITQFIITATYFAWALLPHHISLVHEHSQNNLKHSHDLLPYHLGVEEEQPDYSQEDRYFENEPHSHFNEHRQHQHSTAEKQIAYDSSFSKWSSQNSRHRHERDEHNIPISITFFPEIIAEPIPAHQKLVSQFYVPTFNLELFIRGPPTKIVS